MNNTTQNPFRGRTSNDRSTENLRDDLKSRLDFNETWIDKLAQLLTDSFGSMWFLATNALFYLVWIFWNLDLIPGLKAFDPFPFGLLTMAVSLLAIFLSIIVLISQNKQGWIADIRQQIDFEINVRAEHEITKILIMLEEIHKEMGITKKTDYELEKMKEATDVEKIQKVIEEAKE